MTNIIFKWNSYLSWTSLGNKYNRRYNASDESLLLDFTMKLDGRNIKFDRLSIIFDMLLCLLL